MPQISTLERTINFIRRRREMGHVMNSLFVTPLEYSEIMSDPNIIPYIHTDSIFHHPLIYGVDIMPGDYNTEFIKQPRCEFDRDEILYPR